MTDSDYSFQVDLFNLKMHHIEYSKFVTANDLFPVNCYTLFNVRISTHTRIHHMHLHFKFNRDLVNYAIEKITHNSHIFVIIFLQMSAAIVTHLTILLQFQQSENYNDDKKLLKKLNGIYTNGDK